MKKIFIAFIVVFMFGCVSTDNRITVFQNGNIIEQMTEKEYSEMKSKSNKLKEIEKSMEDGKTIFYHADGNCFHLEFYREIYKEKSSDPIYTLRICLHGKLPKQEENKEYVEINNRI